MPDIFLSYRRQDAQSATGRLADRLEQHFGAARVFRDHASIVAGDDFAAAIRRAIRASTVLLVVVGCEWLDARGASGARRLDDPADFVRLEIEAALADAVAIVPVLVEGAAMPGAARLPPSLAAFARCQAVELSDLRWHHDVDRLIDVLHTRFAIEAQAAPTTGARGPGGFGAVARFWLDLLDLATHPTRMIARCQTHHVLDHLRAFVFLLLCLAAGNVGVILGVGSRSMPSMAGGFGVGVLKLSAAGLLMGAIVVALLAISLTLAWRLSGVRVEARQVGLILAYIYSGAWLAFGVGALVMGIGLQLGDAMVLERMAGVLFAPGDSGVVDVTASRRWSDVEGLISNALQGRGALPVVLLGLSIWLAGAAWTVVAWAAFRHAFGVDRLRSAAATGVWLAILAGLVWLAGGIG